MSVPCTNVGLRADEQCRSIPGIVVRNAAVRRRAALVDDGQALTYAEVEQAMLRVPRRDRRRHRARRPDAHDLGAEHGGVGGCRARHAGGRCGVELPINTPSRVGEAAYVVERSGDRVVHRERLPRPRLRGDAARRRARRAGAAALCRAGWRRTSRHGRLQSFLARADACNERGITRIAARRPTPSPTSCSPRARRAHPRG